MAVSSGVGAQLGIGNETTWGNAVTVGTFLPFTSESIQQSFNYIETAGLRAGNLAQSQSLHTQTTSSVEGSFSLDVLTRKMGKLFNMLHGNTVTPTQQGGTPAYLQTHAIGATTPDTKGLTVQVGRPDVGGTVRPFTYAGVKVASVNFSCEQGGVLTSSWNVVGKSETTATSLETASYTNLGTVFNFTQGSAEFADSVITDCIRSASVTVTLPMATDRYCIGSGTARKEPLVNGLVSVEATLEMEFASLTQHAAFVAATRRKFELIFTGAQISGAYYYKLAFTLPSTVATGEGPVVSGPDVLTQSVTLKGLSNDSDPLLTIEYISEDTTV